jgi:hypothetical protein
VQQLLNQIFSAFLALLLPCFLLDVFVRRPMFTLMLLRLPIKLLMRLFQLLLKATLSLAGSGFTAVGSTIVPSVHNPGEYITPRKLP